MKTYEANRGTWARRIQVTDGNYTYWLKPEPSQKIINHSPDGFEWGYGGSGPAQLALAILVDMLGNTEQARRLHQDFKWAWIANQQKQGFLIHEEDVRYWIGGEGRSRSSAVSQ